MRPYAAPSQPYLDTLNMEEGHEAAKKKFEQFLEHIDLYAESSTYSTQAIEKHIRRAWARYTIVH